MRNNSSHVVLHCELHSTLRHFEVMQLIVNLTPKKLHTVSLSHSTTAGTDRTKEPKGRELAHATTNKPGAEAKSRGGTVDGRPSPHVHGDTKLTPAWSISRHLLQQWGSSQMTNLMRLDRCTLRTLCSQASNDDALGTVWADWCSRVQETQGNGHPKGPVTRILRL